MADLLIFKDRPAWLAWRMDTSARRLGSSDVAAALGLSPWTTPLQLWARFHAPTMFPPPPNAKQMEDGLAWEPRALAILRSERPAFMAEDEIVTGLNDAEVTVAVHDEGWLAATPDAWVLDGERPVGLVQIKTDRTFGADAVWKNGEVTDYGDDEDGPIPIWYWLQVQAEMACAGLPWNLLDVWIPKPMAMPIARRVRVHFEPVRWDRVLRALRQWHHDHIVMGAPPDPSDPDEIERLAKWRYPERPVSRVARSDEGEAIARYLRAAAEAEKFEREAKSLRAKLVSGMGDAARIWCPDGVVKINKRGAVTIARNQE